MSPARPLTGIWSILIPGRSFILTCDVYGLWGPVRPRSHRERLTTRRPTSPHHDVGFGSLHAVQLLDMVDDELVKPPRVRALRLYKNIRHAPASVHVPDTLEFGDCGGEVAHLSRSGVDQDVGPHGAPFPCEALDFAEPPTQPRASWKFDSPSSNGRPSR